MGISFLEYNDYKNRHRTAFNFDRICEEIVRQQISFHVFWEQVFVPNLLNQTGSQPADPILLQEGVWDTLKGFGQRLMGGNSPQPAGVSPVGPGDAGGVGINSTPNDSGPAVQDPYASQNKAFQQKHAQTFEQIKNMFAQGLKEMKDKLQQGAIKLPNAKMIIAGVEAMYNGAMRGAQSYAFNMAKPGSQQPGAVDKLMGGVQQTVNAQSFQQATGMPLDKVQAALKNTKTAAVVKQKLQQVLQATNDPNVKNMIRKVILSGMSPQEKLQQQVQSARGNPKRLQQIRQQQMLAQQSQRQADLDNKGIYGLKQDPEEEEAGLPDALKTANINAVGAKNKSNPGEYERKGLPRPNPEVSNNPKPIKMPKRNKKATGTEGPTPSMQKKEQKKEHVEFFESLIQMHTKTNNFATWGV